MKFRLQALSKLGEPEELDIAPRLVEPRAWIATGVLGIALVAAVVWSFVADVPRTVSARGLLSPSSGTLAVQSPAAGVVTGLAVHLGDVVTRDEQVATVLEPDRTSLSVTSPFAGRVVAVQSAVGQPVSAGGTVVLLAGGNGRATLVAQLFVPTDKAAQLAPGSSVLLSVESAPSAAFGLLRGQVRSVGAQTLTPDQSAALLANPVLQKELASGGPQRLVTVTLQPASTRSGYSWTSGDGPPFELPAQTLVTATIRIGSQHPIDFVFGH